MDHRPDADRARAADRADAYAEAVLDVVARIPAGRAITYGAIAEWLGSGGPRQVGTVMARYGGGVPWHRVVNASGRLVPGHEVEALRRHRAEGTPLRGPNLDRVDLAAAFWSPDEQ
ncbi:MAG TPA: MGMT family protein [Micromonosporaceae bacterium]|nr:MGMT family protein [Micromonosporaceae bacterium]